MNFAALISKEVEEPKENNTIDTYSTKGTNKKLTTTKNCESQ